MFQSSSILYNNKKANYTRTRHRWTNANFMNYTGFSSKLLHTLHAQLNCLLRFKKSNLMTLVWFMSQRWNLFVKRFHSGHKSEAIVSYLSVVNCRIYSCFLFVCIHLINSLGYSWYVCILVLNWWIFLMRSPYQGDVVFVLRFLSFGGKTEIVYLRYEREILMYIAMRLSIQEKLFVNIKTWRKKPQLRHTYKRINCHTGLF